MEDDYKNLAQNQNQKREMTKIGPKLQKNKQCKKQNQNSTIMMLASQKMEQEEILKEKRLEKTIKSLGVAAVHQQSQSRIQEECFDFGDKDEIQFEETKEHYMEEDEDDYIINDGDYAILQNDHDLRINSQKCCDRQSRYNQSYGAYEDNNLYAQEIDLSNCLKNHKIPAQLRSKMVDWMIEVFANYRQTSSDKTYFRSVCILDLFYKKSLRKLAESDVHLFGIAAMFLATKQEDISHISLEDIVEKVGHSKFNERKIREAEYEILKAIDMRTDYPTPYSYLTRYIYRIFNSSTNQSIIELTQFSIYILKQCLHDEKLLEYKSHILAFSTIIISIKIYFTTLRGEQTTSNQNELLQSQEVLIIKQMFDMISSDEHQEAKDCSTKVKDLFFSFSTRFPDLKNLDKFQN